LRRTCFCRKGGSAQIYTVTDPVDGRAELVKL
jgi:hypothetical protein